MSLGPGKKTLAWKMERERLKAKFKDMGIGYCEAMIDPVKCWKTQGLGFAHKRKRRNLKKGELSEVILACPVCHHVLDYELSEDEMCEFVERVIEERKTRVDTAF